jgi:hypothetical protein
MLVRSAGNADFTNRPRYLPVEPAVRLFTLVIYPTINVFQSCQLDRWVHVKNAVVSIDPFV